MPITEIGKLIEQIKNGPTIKEQRDQWIAKRNKPNYYIDVWEELSAKQKIRNAVFYIVNQKEWKKLDEVERSLLKITRRSYYKQLSDADKMCNCPPIKHFINTTDLTEDINEYNIDMDNHRKFLEENDFFRGDDS